MPLPRALSALLEESALPTISHFPLSHAPVSVSGVLYGPSSTEPRCPASGTAFKLGSVGNAFAL